MPSWSLTTPPSWAKDAVATDKGWVDPKNGEVLVACKRLENAVSHAETFGKGVAPAIKKKRGGARPGAGRKTNAERARIAEEKAKAEQATKDEAEKATTEAKKATPKPAPKKRAAKRKPAPKKNQGTEAKQ